MNENPRKPSVSAEIEAVFSECRSHIDEAIRDYRQDIDSAIEQLKLDLAGLGRASAISD